MSARFEFGTRRRPLLAGCLCLAALACGGPGPMQQHGDGGQPDGRDAPASDVPVDHLTPPPPDAPIEASGAGGAGGAGGQDARDGAGGGTADARVEAGADGTVTPTCPVDCSHLPHVRADVVVTCGSNGSCQVPPLACEDGFAHCSANPNDGCEVDVSRPATCGSCYNQCPPYAPNCTKQGAYYYCAQACTAPTPDLCFPSCVDLQSDIYNCGSCGHGCYEFNAVMACNQGQCTFVQCDDILTTHCPNDSGCATALGTDTDCAGCGDASCAIANTLFSCSSANACTAAVCAAGFGNCDSSSPDCETSFASGGTCLPGYLGTTPLATQSVDNVAAAIGTDGSFFVAGAFMGTVDFDPSAGQDIRTPANPGDLDGFITKINADGSYAWTRTFTGRGGMAVQGLAAASGGAIVASGWYQDTVDLDPGAAVDLHQTALNVSQDAVVVKLGADGSFVWGKTFAGTDYSANGDAVRVAVDGADAVYVAGNYQGTVDFDPGPGTTSRTVSSVAGMIVKLTAAGDLSWVQSFNNGPCGASLRGIAVATDGSVWGAGVADSGPGCTLTGPPNAYGTDGLIVSCAGATGAARGVWTLGGGGVASTLATGAAAGPSGSVYISGISTGPLDLDPGPGVATRWVSASQGGFILRLGSDGGFNWAATVPNVTLNSIAAASDGGVLGAGNSGSGSFVTRLNVDGTSQWSFAAGTTQTTAVSVAARGASFAVAGASSGSGDFNPGAAIDVVFGDIVYVSRFSF